MKRMEIHKLYYGLNNLFKSQKLYRKKLQNQKHFEHFGEFV